MKYTVTKHLHPDTVAEMQEILNIRQGIWDEAGGDEVIRTFTARFSDGYEADIKVCNGDPPYVDAVLFDPNGCEAHVLATSDSLLGKYLFQHGEHEYHLTLEQAQLDKS